MARAIHVKGIGPDLDFAFRPVDRAWASVSWWLLLVRDVTDTSILK